MIIKELHFPECTTSSRKLAACHLIVIITDLEHLKRHGDS